MAIYVCFEYMEAETVELTSVIDWIYKEVVFICNLIKYGTSTPFAWEF